MGSSFLCAQSTLPRVVFSPASQNMPRTNQSQQASTYGAKPPWATDEEPTLLGRRKVQAQSVDVNQTNAQPSGRINIQRSQTVSAQAPWATDYEEPQRGRTPPHAGMDTSLDAEPSSGGMHFARDSMVIHKGQAARQVAIHAEELVADSSSSGDWKRPKTMAPKWAAGGGQELLVPSPSQGRKVCPDRFPAKLYDFVFRSVGSTARDCRRL